MSSPTRQLTGPRAHPLFTALSYGFRPQRFAATNAQRYGRTYLLRNPGMPMLVTAEPEYVRRIFAADSDTFRSFGSVTLSALFGPHSVLLTHAAPHKHMRKLLAPPLSGPRLRAFGATMQILADKHVAGLVPGSTFSAHALALRFTLDVIVRTVFGLTAESAATELRGLLSALVHEIPAIAIFAPGFQDVRFPPWARYLRTQRRFEAWLRRTLAERRASPNAGEDVLSILLAARYENGTPVSDDDIHDQLVTLLLAGHETTALTLARTLERLHLHEHVLVKLRAELNAAGTQPEDLQRLPYLSAVLDETLRIDPIVTDVARVATRPVELGDGLVIAKNQVVLVMMEALHHDPALYPAPAEFRPERFLERKFLGHEYAPFGGGVRRCIGAAFSDYESKILLATLLREKTLAPVHKGLSRRVRRNITMGPKHDVPMRVVR